MCQLLVLKYINNYLLTPFGPVMYKNNNYFDVDVVISELIILFSVGRVVTLALSVFIMVVFSLSCSNSPLRS